MPHEERRNVELRRIVRRLVRVLLHRYILARGRSRLTRIFKPLLPPDERLTVRGPGGMRIALDLSQSPSQQVYWFGSWEPDDARVLADRLRPGMVAFDIGANVGIVTVTIARLVAEEGHVHAFEPEPSNFELLAQNVDQNGLERWVTLNQVALSDRDGPLNIRRGDDAASAYVSDDPVDDLTIEVPGMTVDAYAKAVELSRLDLAKIDVEGAELLVLRGATETLRRFRPVLLIECAARHLRRSGATARDLLELLAEIGYDTFIPSARGLRRVALDASDAKLPGNDNLICLPATHTDSSRP